MQDEKAVLVDIRLSPRSRWQPAWNQSALIERWGDRYIHLPELGNLHYKPEDREKGIKLANPEQGLHDLETYVLRAGYTAVVMCACKSYETCHRHVVCELIGS
jgi:uncharacterized protein (DUF488 family)